MLTANDCVLKSHTGLVASPSFFGSLKFAFYDELFENICTRVL